MIKKTYHYVLSLAGHKYNIRYLSIVSFFESIFFPIPPDVMLVPMMLKHPKRSFLYASYCLFFSVFGGVIAYFIGFYLYDIIGARIIEFYAMEQKLHHVKQLFHRYDWWLILAAAFTPIPYKLITITSGILGVFFPVFVIASFLGRGARFFLLATLFYFTGKAIALYIERYFSLFTYVFFFSLFIIFMIFTQL